MPHTAVQWLCRELALLAAYGSGTSSFPHHAHRCARDQNLLIVCVLSRACTQIDACHGRPTAGRLKFEQGDQHGKRRPIDNATKEIPIESHAVRDGVCQELARQVCGLQEQDQQGPPIPRCQRYNCARGASHGHVPPAPARSAARGAAARLLSAAASPRPGRAALRLALHHARARPRLDQMEVRLMLEAPKGAPWPCSLATQLNWLHLSGWQGSGVIEPIRGLGQCAAGAWVGWSSLGGGPVREFGDGTAQSGRHPGMNAPSPELDPELSATAARRRN